MRCRGSVLRVLIMLAKVNVCRCACWHAHFAPCQRGRHWFNCCASFRKDQLKLVTCQHITFDLNQLLFVFMSRQPSAHQRIRARIITRQQTLILIGGRILLQRKWIPLCSFAYFGLRRICGICHVRAHVRHMSYAGRMCGTCHMRTRLILNQTNFEPN